jgi:hypothetical protein
MDSGHLRLNSDLVNLQFSNWRLSLGIVQHVDTTDLHQPVYTAEADALNFVHTRVSVLHNHLYRGREGTLYFFSRGESLFLHRLLLGDNNEIQESVGACPTLVTEQRTKPPSSH